MSVTQTTIRMKCGRAAPHVLWTVATCLPLALSTQLAMARTASRPVHSVDPYIIAQAPAPESPAAPATPASPPAPASPPVPAAPPAAATPHAATPPAATPTAVAPAPAAASAKPDSTQKSDKTTASSAASESEGIPAVVIDGQQVESILGKKVRSNSGEDMGRIIDVIVDKSGQIRAAIIDFGGFLGVGTRQIAVDWRTIRFPSDQKSESLAVDLTRDQLRVAPVYKAGEQIVVLGRPRAEPAATAPQASAAPPPVATKETTPASIAKDPNPAPSPTPTAAPAPPPPPAAKDPATPQ